MYDVFISYASVNREWAAKLAADLAGRGLKVFYDQSALRDAVPWESQLNDALRSSTNLVCLWSAHANVSPWVQAELGMFRAQLVGPSRVGAKLFMVPLDAQPHAFASVQNVDVAAVKTAYAAGGVASVSPADWSALVKRIETGVRTQNASLQVHVALLTLDSAARARLSPWDRQRIQAELGLTAGELESRYGPRRLDWTPFTKGITIESHLDVSREDINKWLAKSLSTEHERMSWVYPDDEQFWSDQTLDDARSFASRMENNQPGLIIIDPVATLVASVQNRLSLFSRYLRHGNVAIIAPHHIPPTSQDLSFRTWVSTNTVALLNEYVDPRQVPDQPMNARFGIGVDDIGELRRLLKTSIGDVLRGRNTAVAPAAAAIRN